MKTLRPGQQQPAPIPPPRFWLGLEAQCPHCHGIFKLEDGDGVTILAATPNVGRHAEFICPTPHCHTIVWLYERGQDMAQGTHIGAALFRDA